MSTLSKSEIGPSFSTFQRAVSASTNWVRIKRVGSDVGVKGEQVIHVAPKNEALERAVDNFVGDGSEGAQRRWPHRGAEGLVEIDPRYLCAALYTEPGFHCAAALSLIHPNKTDKRAASGNFGSVNGCPAFVVLVVSNLGTFGTAPPYAVLSHCLFTRARVLGYVADCKGASSTTSPCRFVATGAESEQSSGSTRTKGSSRTGAAPEGALAFVGTVGVSGGGIEGGGDVGVGALFGTADGCVGRES
eukprot:1132813-Pleurochrysis_carterae.AAC.2